MPYTTTLGFRILCRLVLFCFTFATLHPANLRIPWTLSFAQATFDFGPPLAYGKTQHVSPVPILDATSGTVVLTESGDSTPMVRLPGHVLPALAEATPVAATPGSVAEQPLTLTLVLKRDDQAGFERYLRDVYNPKAPNYRKFLTQSELSDRFGPSRETYDKVLSYLQNNGFTLVEGSANRLTLTVRGTRVKAEHAFNVTLKDFDNGGRRFFTNTDAPSVPSSIAGDVQAVTGLSGLATRSPVRLHAADELESQGGKDPLFAKNFPWHNPNQADQYCAQYALGHFGGQTSAEGVITSIFFNVLCLFFKTWVQTPQGDCMDNLFNGSGNLLDKINFCKNHLPPIKFPKIQFPPLPLRSLSQVQTRTSSLNQGAALVQTTPQKIGITAFDTFRRSDVQDWLSLTQLDPALITRLSQVHVNGGVSTPGVNQSEVLLDINTVMLLDLFDDTNYVVYDAPLSTSFATMFNVMVNDGNTVISNSWSQCEDQTTPAEVQAIDSILAQAAASGITVFNASGDTGSTCLNGSANTVGVPANSPHAIAVGGTTLSLGPGMTYGSERYWDDTSVVPPGGAGGFGVSKYFSRPSYQDGFTTAAGRSLPDLAMPAGPPGGMMICQADAGGCPNGLFYGGTSMAAPAMAVLAANLNAAVGSNIVSANPMLYNLARTNPDAFHSASTLGSDFSHVGLGSPNFAVLLAALRGHPIGPVDGAASRMFALGRAPADGTATGFIRVNLSDVNGYPVGGKTVTITPSAGSSAKVVDVSGTSDTTGGAVVFAITNLVAESVTFTATDTTDGVPLSQTATLTFDVPLAASGNITASPTPVIANGIATTTITVTLKDALNRPTPGKEVRLSQGTGHSVITGPNPSVTNSNGQIQFTASNLFNETITYTAIDVTDGDLPVPGNAVVTFSNSTNLCPSPASIPTGENGYVVTPFATGFVSRPLTFGGITYGGCPGVSTPAFLDDSVFFTDWTGDAIKLPAAGGAVTNANRLANVGQTLAWPVVSKGGKLYAARASTGSGISGVIVEINPTTGAVVRTLASGLSCPFSLVIDPLSGDLFFDGGCDGSFTDPRVRRIRNPDSATPTLEDYVTLPASPNGKMSFAPDGTLYVVTGYFNASPTISRVSGTNVPGTPTITTVPGVNSNFWVNIGEASSNGAARSLLTLTPSTLELELVDITTNPPTRTVLAKNLGGGEIGPDGCLYAPIETVIYRVTDSTGSCRFASATPRPSLTLTPTTISPNPAQGIAQTFTATLRNLNVPAGTPISLAVIGANQQMLLARTDATSRAEFTYVGTFTGTDTLVATTTVGSQTLTSNKAAVTWAAGKHTTFLALNLSPTASTPGQPVTVMASLTDVSSTPPVSILGQAVTFTLGSAQCVGTTNSNGIASCALVPSVVGMGTLNASFAGNAQFVASSDAVGFNVIAAAPSCVPATEVCDGQDNDCDGQTDEGLGTVSCGVGTCARTVDACVSGIPQTCTPGTPTAEVCDGQDNSCNGQIDNGLGTLSCGVGACARTVNACVNGTSQTCTPGTPTAEVCGDGIDNNCNGQIDDTCPPPSADACTITTVLDTFNRADGSVGNNWRGVTGTSFYRIAGNRLDVQLGGPLYWNPTAFGTNQTAFVTLSTVDSKGPSQGVLLKVQDGSVPSAGAISVVYDATAKAVRVSTIRLGAPAWTPYGNTAATFMNGDKLGACAKANGEVRVYKNDVLVKAVTLNTADKKFFNAKGGKVGVWTLLAPHAFLDTFGGATLAP